jgi:hypothetical protein
MHSDLDLEHMDTEAIARGASRTTREIESIVMMTRLELYNQGRPCGADKIHRRLNQHYRVKPLPSKRTIARILVRNGLTHGRTGWYDGEKCDVASDGASPSSSSSGRLPN